MKLAVGPLSRRFADAHLTQISGTITQLFMQCCASNELEEGMSKIRNEKKGIRLAAGLMAVMMMAAVPCTTKPVVIVADL